MTSSVSYQGFIGKFSSYLSKCFVWILSAVVNVCCYGCNVERSKVRLIKNGEGRSKGFAYIEFTDESSANVAVARLNNSDELGMKRMSVAISNPPKGGAKGTFGGPEPETGFKCSTFAPRDMQDNNPIVTSRRKTNILLLPRALAKRAVSGDKNTTSSTSGEGNKLSNDDFRKLLAKK